MNKKESNSHRAINIIQISENDLQKYKIVKENNLFLKDDLILLYDDQYVKIGEANRLLKMKITKENSVYRIK